jgi:hypothetical protein
MHLAKLYVAVAALAVLNCVSSQATAQSRPITSSAGAPPGGDLSLDNFEYQYGNTANLVRPADLALSVLTRNTYHTRKCVIVKPMHGFGSTPAWPSDFAQP